jgi:catechol 2,3-dioxygenase-like lactoylglutathione lyase family enzyme
VTDLRNPFYIGRSFDQICFVVEDFDAAIDKWTNTLGVERWSVAYDLAKYQRDKEYWGEPEDFQFSCAYGFAGDTLIELARHDGGRSIYKDWIDDGNKGPHHIGFRVADATEYAAAEKHYADVGVARAQAGVFAADSGGCWWAYYDTRDIIGCYTELYYLTGVALTQYDLYKRGEADSLIPS